MLSSSLSRQFIVFAISTAFSIQSQGQNLIDNVAKAFNSISAKPNVYFLNTGKIKIPAGGHLQGIQIYDSCKLVLTASSGSYAYYLTADMSEGEQIKRIQAINKISDSPFRHAGGCQVYKNQLLVGIEDNIAKDKSKVVLISLADTLKAATFKVVTERKGGIKRETAGATGFTRLNNGQYLAAVGDWTSRNIDFYLCITAQPGKFDSLSNFHAPENVKWPSYQSINLITDSSGNIYLAGFALDGMKNRADLFKVTIEKNSVQLSLVNTRYFNCRMGAGFRFGTGIAISDKGCIAIICCCRKAGHRTTINIFN